MSESESDSLAGVKAGGFGIAREEEKSVLCCEVGEERNGSVWDDGDDIGKGPVRMRWQC